MNALGWLVMITSVGSVLALTAYCLHRVLTLPPAEVESLDTAPLNIDTGDTENAD